MFLQKNPGTIRTAEEDRGKENYTMDLFVDVPRAGFISKHVPAMCAEAGDATYTRRLDIDLWSQLPGKSFRKPSVKARIFNFFIVAYCT